MVSVTVVPQVVHPKTRVSGAQSFGRTVGSTRVSRIGALQFGHHRVSVTIDDVMGHPLTDGADAASQLSLFAFCYGLTGSLTVIIAVGRWRHTEAMKVPRWTT
jgi:hypothetical protein